MIFAGEDPTRVEEARRSAEVFLNGAAKSEISIYGFRDGFLPYQGELVKEAFEESSRPSCRTSFSPITTMTGIRTTGSSPN